MADSTAGSRLNPNAGAAFVFKRTATTWNFEQKIVPTGAGERNSSDSFGYDGIALSGSTIALSAIGYDLDSSGTNSLSNAGAVFIFTRSGSVWTEQQILTPSGTNARSTNNRFGEKLGLNGNTLVVAEPKHKYDENGNNAITDAGAAWVFNQSSSVWLQQAKLVTTGAGNRQASDAFGTSVVVKEKGANGFFIGIGAPGNDYMSPTNSFYNAAGAIYLFE